MAGYSGTPLPKKLGIKEGSRILFVNAPASLDRDLEALPEGATILRTARAPLDVVLIFVKSEKELLAQFAYYAERLAPAGRLWIAWPKKTSGVATDLIFENVQRIGLATGLVDNKVCAIDETWSGLQFVIRKKDRSAN
jgi:hypothetical protein